MYLCHSITVHLSADIPYGQICVMLNVKRKLYPKGLKLRFIIEASFYSVILLNFAKRANDQAIN